MSKDRRRALADALTLEELEVVVPALEILTRAGATRETEQPVAAAGRAVSL